DRVDEAGGGFTVLDGAALVIGAAVGSVHIRGAVPSQGLGGYGWSLLWVTLLGVALTAAGPFVFVVRRYWRHARDFPRTGDWLWLPLGLPWLVTLVLRPRSWGQGPWWDVYQFTLHYGTLAASVVALAVIWRTRVMADADHHAKKRSSAWTERVGTALAVA